MWPPRQRVDAPTLTRTVTNTTFYKGYSNAGGYCSTVEPCTVEQEAAANKMCSPQTVQPASTATPRKGLPKGLLFELVNPKNLDEAEKRLLECAVQLYHQELPAMSFAANTGKESNFVRNCTTSGKYCTLMITTSGATPTDNQTVVGAITYQILPPDTQFAEIPLAAVDRAWQRKGLGGSLLKELVRRLKDVGLLTLFCWGDQESECFWSKQGFRKIAEVDSKGKPQKLPLKADIRKAMSLPGNAALMVCNIRSPISQLTSMATPLTMGALTPTKELETNSGTKDIGVPVFSVDVQESASVDVNAVTKPSSASLPAIEVPPVSSHDETRLPPPKRIYTKRSLQMKTAATRMKIPYSTITVADPSPAIAKLTESVSFAAADRCTVPPTQFDISGLLPEEFTVKVRTPPARVLESPIQPSVMKSEAADSSPVVAPSEAKVSMTWSDMGPSDARFVTPPRAMESRHAVSPPPTARPCETEAQVTLSPHAHVVPWEPLGNVNNVSGRVTKVFMKKGPRRAIPCLAKTIAAVSAPRPPTTSHDSDKENADPVITTKMETEQEECGDIVKSGQKRCQEEQSDSETIDTKPAKVQRCTPVETSEPALQEPDDVLDPVTPSKLDLSSQSAHGAVEPDTNTMPSSRCVKTDNGHALLSAMADACVSRLNVDVLAEPFHEQQEATPTIKKRMASGLVEVPELEPPRTLSSKLEPPEMPVIFLSMSHDSRKTALAELVKRLKGKVTDDGSKCTHVVAGEVRRTINFCSALCHGAWIVSPEWLKASSRQKRFIDEKPYLLKDKQYQLKYKVTIASAIQKAQRRPCLLLAGFSIYPTPHLQPPHETIIKLTEAAGGKILSSLDEALQQADPSSTIVLGCEQDIEEGIAAAKAGLRTFTGEWFMQSIVKQDLDMSANLIEKI